MGQVSASSTVLINAEPEAVLAAVADYQTVRPKILSAHYSDYQVLEGGQGAGTVASWKLQATKSRVRDVKADVDVAGHTVIEKDANSSMVTNWTVAPAGTGLVGHRQDVVAGRGRRQGLLREDVRAVGAEEDSGRGAGQPEEDRRGRLAGLRAEEACDTAHHGVGVLLPDPRECLIRPESAGFFMLPSSTRIDGYCARFSPAMSERGLSPPVPM